ncbi:heat shock 70 kDa protein 14-like [Babylonia areolata]|uniref:heat shock 70 kDa protein 14-like n=1 Tax=Babylonia areolata TaxID=304850 RepID=UPI003FD2D492
MAAYGIHLGTCSACLAVYQDGKTNVAVNDAGDRSTPCVVGFTSYDLEVGASAKQGIVSNARNTVCHVKRILGRSFEDPVTQEYVASSPVKVVNQNNQPVFEVEFKEKKQNVSADSITEMIYKKVLETAQSHGGKGIQDAVLAVPGDFSAEQRKAASAAASKAGFKVLRLINECSAAALAYDLGQLDNTETFKVLVYRLGGTSHDATVLQVQNGIYRVLGSCMDHSFGSNNFTRVLQNYLASEFYKMYKSDPKESKRSMARLLLAAERCKHALSIVDNAKCDAESVLDGIDFSANISRVRFENLCPGTVEQCTQLIQQALSKASCTKEDISKVVLCGGGTNMPLVQRTITRFLPSSDILSSVPGDELIAIGAAKEAGILASKDKSELEAAQENNTFQCLAQDIGFETTDGVEVVLAAGTIIPFRAHHTATLGPEQTSFRMTICEAAAEDSAESQKLAKLVMRDLPAGAAIKTSFHLKREGGLHVTAHEPSSGQQESMLIPVTPMTNHS